MEGKSKREIVTTRIMKAPQEDVFRAWTTPHLLAQWWGPKGFTNTIHSFDLRPGGLWDFTMHSPNGASFHNQCVFMEITSPGRLVFKHLLPVHEFIVTATFDRIDALHTRVTFCMLFTSVEECEKVKNYVPQANEQNFDRLEVVLSTSLKQSIN